MAVTPDDPSDRPPADTASSVYPPPADYDAPWPVVADWWLRTHGSPATDEVVTRHAYARTLAAWRHHAAVQMMWQAPVQQAAYGSAPASPPAYAHPNTAWGGAAGWDSAAGWGATPAWTAPAGWATPPRRRRTGSLVAVLVLILVAIPLVFGGIAVVSWDRPLGSASVDDGPVPSGGRMFEPSREQLEYFLEVGPAIDGDRIVRWERDDVDVVIEGPSTPDDRQTVEEAVADVNRSIGEPDFSFSDSSSTESAEIVIRFLEHEDFVALDTDDEAIGWCNMNYSGYDYSIRHATISIDDSPEYRSAREGVIYHELGHAIGLDDVYKARWSQTIMYYTVSSPEAYTNADRAAISMLYDPRLDEGDTTSDIKRVFAPQ